MLQRRWHFATLILGAALAVAFTALTVARMPSSSGAVLPTFPFRSAQVSAVLAKLPTPVGFTRGPCTQVPGNVDTACFGRSHPITLDTALMHRLARTFEATLDLPTHACERPHSYASAHAALAACDERATLDTQHLLIIVTSTGAGRAPRRVPAGAQVTVSDYGS
jgi:hypothetical protein